MPAITNGMLVTKPRHLDPWTVKLHTHARSDGPPARSFVCCPKLRIVRSRAATEHRFFNLADIAVYYTEHVCSDL